MLFRANLKPVQARSSERRCRHPNEINNTKAPTIAEPPTHGNTGWMRFLGIPKGTRALRWAPASARVADPEFAGLELENQLDRSVCLLLKERGIERRLVLRVTLGLGGADPGGSALNDPIRAARLRHSNPSP